MLLVTAPWPRRRCLPFTEQNRLLRHGFVQLLRKRSALTVVGDSNDCTEAIAELTANPCDVLLLKSQEALLAIRQRVKTAECLKQIELALFGMGEDPESFLQAVQMGARGYPLNEASSAEIIAAVKGVAQGDAICPPKLCKSLFAISPRDFFCTQEEWSRGAARRMT